MAHAAYPGLAGESTPASLSPRIHQILRGPVGFEGVVYTDDLSMGALQGSLPERALRAARAGADVLCVPKATLDEYADSVRETAGLDHAPTASRLDALRARCDSTPRPSFNMRVWDALRGDVEVFLELLERPRVRRSDPPVAEGERGNLDPGSPES